MISIYNKALTLAKGKNIPSRLLDIDSKHSLYYCKLSRQLFRVFQNTYYGYVRVALDFNNLETEWIESINDNYKEYIDNYAS